METRGADLELDAHDAKEEPILYPHADRVLGAPASAELAAFLERGHMPAGLDLRPRGRVGRAR